MALTVTIGLTNLSTAEALWTSYGAGGTGALAVEPDFYAQGANSNSRGVTGVGTQKGGTFNYATGVNFQTGGDKDKLVYIWLRCSTPGACDTIANGGVRVILGSGTTAPGDAAGVWSAWYVDGSNTIDATDGWTCYVIDPQSTPSTTYGGGVNLAAVTYFGGVMRSNGTLKGQNFGLDRVSYGRGELLVSGTVTTAGKGFEEIAAADFGDITNGRFGIVTVRAGVIYVRGKIVLGHATANTTFSSYGEQVVFESPHYYSAGSVVRAIPNASVGGTAGSDGQTSYLGLGFIGGTGTTAIDLGVIAGTDRGRSGPSLTVPNNAKLGTPAKTLATVTATDASMGLGLYGTSFKGFEGAIDLRGTYVDDDDCYACTFDGCGRIDSNMELRNCNVLNSVAVATDGALIWGSDVNIQSCLFAGNSRAIVFESDAGTPFTFQGLTFSGNTVDVRNEDADPITINCSGGTYPPSSETTGGTVTFASTITLTVGPVEIGSEVRAYETGTSTEVDGVETATGTTVPLDLVASQAVDIVVLCYGPPMIPVRINNRSFAASQSFDPQQRPDPNFSDPE